MGTAVAGRTEKTGLSRPAILGFACNQGFIFSLFFMGLNRALFLGDAMFERADLFGTLLFMVVAFLVVRSASPQARRALLSRPLVGCYAVLLVVGSFLPLLSLEPGLGEMFVESLLVGLPSGMMLVAWGEAFGRRTLRTSVPEVFIAPAIGAAVCFAFASIGVPEALLVLKLLPLGSAAALLALTPSETGAAFEGRAHDSASGMARSSLEQGVDSPRRLSWSAVLATPDQRARTKLLSRKIIAGTALFGLATGFMETYGSDPGMAAAPNFPVTLLLFVLFCVAALQLIVTGGLDPQGAPSGGANSAEGPLDGVYRLAILVMMAGFLFVPVLSDFGVPGEAIELVGYLGLTYVLVSLFLVIARLTGCAASLSFSRGFAALFAGEMVGIALGNVIDLVQPTGQTPYAVVACAGLAALFAYLFLFTERDFHALSVIAEDADRFDGVCATLAERFGLSNREAEILPFALRGRTGERIAAEFGIAKSTVDTHLRRIYVKTGVHGRQELIDLGEREVESSQRK